MKLQVLAAVVITLYTLALSVLVVFQRNLLYPAPQAFRETPASRNLDYEEVNLDPGFDETTHGWFIPAKEAKGVVIYSHGNGDNVGSSMDEAAFLHKQGYGVMLYDYGGYGLSSGSPTEKRNYADIRAAWKYLTETRGIPADRIVLFGISLGGGMSTQLAQEVDAAALVLEGTFTTIPDTAHSHFPLLNFDKIMFDQYRNVEKIATVGEPVLILHSKTDKTVPFELGKRLYEAAQEPRKFVELKMGHAKGIKQESETYAKAWEEFINPLFENMEPLNFE